MTEHLGAKRHEQTEERVGPLSLQVSQTRDGSFKTEIFKRYQPKKSSWNMVK